MTETLVLAVRVAVSLGLVLALLWFLSRRLGSSRTPGRRLPITVLGRQALGRRSGITVVDVAGRTLVLGVSDQGVRLLTELEAGPFRLAEDADHDGDGVVPGSAPGQVAPTREGPGLTLGGSVLAPGTWRTSWEALRDGLRR